jgi:hypothetical protein
MANLLLSSLTYLLVTNKYVVPYLPYLLGITSFSPYYPLVKNAVFFFLTFLLTYIIFYIHNRRNPDYKDKTKNPKNFSIGSISYNDTLTVMFVVLLIYFLISVLIFAVPILKITFDTTFDSIFFVVAFGVISFLYAIITDYSIKLKTISAFKNTFLTIAIFILFALYTVFNDKISGSLPGLNLIPNNVKRLINLSIKMSIAKEADLKKSLKDIFKDSLTDDAINKFVKLIKAAFGIIPETGRKIIDKFKGQTHILDKLLGGPIEINQQYAKQLKEIIDNPMIKLALSI